MVTVIFMFLVLSTGPSRQGLEIPVDYFNGGGGRGEKWDHIGKIRTYLNRLVN